MKFFSMWGIGAQFSNATPRQVWVGWGAALAMIWAVIIPACTVGCGMSAAPQPPSLQLPKTVRDLTAVRVGNQVDLHWNTPSETADRLKIRGRVQMRICRQLSAASYQSIAIISAAPGKPADYMDDLPVALTSGTLHLMTYEIFGINKHGRSAGASNAARTLAGEAPPPVQNLSATMEKRGVILHWQSVPGLLPDISIQLHRTLLTVPVNSSASTHGGLPPVSEPIDQTLQVTFERAKTDPGVTLDNTVTFSRKYQYAAARITGLKVGTERLQVASAPSAPTIILTRDTFPPAAPAGLAAVPVPAAINGGEPEVDLSWSANMEPDVAQYLVYRRNVGAEASGRQSGAEQIAPKDSASPIVVPAFRDMNVQPGHTYAYSVIAVDNAGNKSARAPEVVVTVPSS